MNGSAPPHNSSRCAWAANMIISPLTNPAAMRKARVKAAADLKRLLRQAAHPHRRKQR